MPITDCSHCGEQVDAIPYNETDTMFDWRCPSCGEGVLIDGNAREKERQREAREQLSQQVQDLADVLDTPSYQPAPLPVSDLKDRLEEILEDVDRELERR